MCEMCFITSDLFLDLLYVFNLSILKPSCPNFFHLKALPLLSLHQLGVSN